MSTFEGREQQFEAKFQHDEELRFKVGVRRNRLLGEWAGKLMGLEGDALVAYAREVVESDFKEKGDQDVVDKVLGDLLAKGVDMSEHRVRRHMEELLLVAKRQIMTE